MVPVHSQVAIFGRNVAFCSSVPQVWIALTAPWVNDAYMYQEWFAAENISSTSTATRCGMPMPPNSSAACIVAQPAS